MKKYQLLKAYKRDFPFIPEGTVLRLEHGAYRFYHKYGHYTFDQDYIENTPSRWREVTNGIDIEEITNKAYALAGSSDARVLSYTLFRVKLIADTLNEGWEPNWDDKTEKYYICYSHSIKEFVIASTVHLLSAPVYYKTEQLASQAKDICGADYMLLLNVPDDETN